MPNFVPKTSDQIQEQIEQVDQLLGCEIVPADLREEILSMPVEDLTENFRARYLVYLKLLRHLNAKNVDNVDEDNKLITALNNLVRYMQEYQNDPEKRTLYDEQMDVFESFSEFLEKGNKSGYVKLPTGYGKTVIFTELIEALGLKTLIVVPRRVLVEQTEDKLRKFAPDLDVGKIYSECHTHGKDVTIITYDSLLRQVGDGTLNPADFDCLILDEAHRALSELRVDVIDKFQHTIRLGFTATPDFSDSKKVSNLLGEEICCKSTLEAIQEGNLSSVRVMLAKTDIDLSKVKICTNGEYDEKDLEKAINIKSRNLAAVELYARQFKGQKGVAYCVGINHAKELAEIFESKGVKAAAIYGDMPKNEQDEIFEKVKKGEIDVICNADLLIEGWDDPTFSICVNLRPTKSRVVAEQRGGRVLRVDKTNPDKIAYVIDILDKTEGDSDSPTILYSDVIFGDVLGVAEAVSPKRKNPMPPLPGADIKIEGLELITDPQLIAEIISQRRVNSVQDLSIKQKINDLIEAGWKNIYALAKEANKSIKNAKNTLRNIDPLKRRDNEFHEYLHPDLYEEVKNELMSDRGWILALTLARKLDIPYVEARSLLTVCAEVGKDYHVKARNGAHGYHDVFVEPLYAEKKCQEYILANRHRFISIQDFARTLGLMPAELWDTMDKSEQDDCFVLNPNEGEAGICLRKSLTVKLASSVMVRKGFVTLDSICAKFNVKRGVAYQRLSEMMAVGEITGVASAEYKNFSELYIPESQVEKFEAEVRKFVVLPGVIGVQELAMDLGMNTANTLRAVMARYLGNPDDFLISDGKVKKLSAETEKRLREIMSNCVQISTFSAKESVVLLKFNRWPIVGSHTLGFIEKKYVSEIIKEVEEIEKRKRWVNFEDCAVNNGFEFGVNKNAFCSLMTAIKPDEFGLKFAKHQDSGLQLVLAVNPDYINKVEEELRKIKQHSTVSGIVREIEKVTGGNEDNIRIIVLKIIKETQFEYPDKAVFWLKDQSDAYVSPGMERVIRKSLPPANWQTNFDSTVKNRYGLNTQQVAQLREKHADKFGVFYNPATCEKNEYFDPAVLEHGEDYLQVAPGDVMTFEEAGEKLALDESSFLEVIRKAKIEFPETIRVYKNNDGLVQEFISREYVDKLCTFMEAPEGWETVNQIASANGVSVDKIRKIIAGFGNAVAREFFDKKSGTKKNYYSPETVEEIEGAL